MIAVVMVLYFFLMAQKPLMGQGLIIEASR